MAEYDADKITRQCRAEFEAGLKFRYDREKQWKQNEDFYFNRVLKNIKSKFNVPVPIVSGFVDTWTSKMMKHPVLSFEQAESADYMATKKATALYNQIKNHDDYDWDMIDTDGNKIACIYGKATSHYQAHSEPKYKSELVLVDPYDMIDDPMGGADTEKYKFRQQDNFFRSREELKEGVEHGIYDAGQVTKIINAVKSDRIQSNDSLYQSKQNRYMVLGLNGISYNYAGQDLYKFVVAGTMWGGKRYYVVFNYETGLWIRCELLSEVFKSNLWPWVSWAPIRDAFTPLPKAPVEDIIPIAETIRVLVNQELDNRNKRNYGQRAFDPDVFPNPAELEWRQDGLVEVKFGTSKVMEIDRGIYEFQTPEMQGTINLVNWLDNMLKEKSGVNSEAQGATDTSKVGIAYLNVQQSAERIRQAFESKTKYWQGIGKRVVWGFWEHMRTPMAVKIIGEKGEEWDKLARREINTDWNVRISGGEEDMNKDEIKKKALRDTLATLNPAELAVLNPKETAKVKLEAAEVDEDRIAMLFDLSDETNKEVLSRASQMIQDALADKPIKPYRGATTAFIQKILDFATEQMDDDEKYWKLIRLVDMHKGVVSENMARKAVQMRTAQGLPPAPEAGLSETPAPNTLGGTQSMSQGMTNMAPRPVMNNLQ